MDDHLLGSVSLFGGLPANIVNGTYVPIPVFAAFVGTAFAGLVALFFFLNRSLQKTERAQKIAILKQEELTLSLAEKNSSSNGFRNTPTGLNWRASI